VAAATLLLILLAAVYRLGQQVLCSLQGLQPQLEALRAELITLRQVAIGDYVPPGPLADLQKEAYRRKMVIAELLESIPDLVAAGISKAFSKR
jgi:hypothetical protein